jgi:RNA polymerase sigma-70 factor (ECF subfamily)
MPYSSRELLAALPRLRRYARFLVDDPAGADDIVAKTLERARIAAGADVARSRRAELLALLRTVHAEELAKPTPPRIASFAANDAAAGEPDDSRATQVLEELRRLSIEQREVVVLVAVERMSYDEVATLLRVPVATVLSRLQEARGALRSSAIGRTSTQTGQGR